MALVELVDDTFVVADRASIAAVVRDPERWREWWPYLKLKVETDRGLEGVRWSVSGALVGSAEIWLEEWGDGVLVHHYLCVDPPPGPHPGADRLRRDHARSWKRHVFALKDQLEGGRRPGEPSIKVGQPHADPQVS